MKIIGVLYILFACFGVSYFPYTYMDYVANKNADDYACDDNGNIDIKKRSEYFQNNWDKNDSHKLYGFDFSYSNIKSKSLKTGLDFNGGVSILLDFHINNIIKDITHEDYKNQICEILNDIKLEREDYDLKDYVEAVITKADAIEIDLSKCFLSPDSKNRNLTVEEIKVSLCDFISNKIFTEIDIITKRLRQYGINELYIYNLCGGRIIQIEIPSEVNYDDIKDLLQHNGDLQFYLEYDSDASEKLIKVLNEVIETPSDKLSDQLKELSLVKKKQKLNNDMLYSKDIANDVEEFLNSEEIKNFYSKNLKICKRTIYEEAEEKDDTEKGLVEEKKNDNNKENHSDVQENENNNKKENENDDNVTEHKVTRGGSKNINEKVKFYFINLGDDGRGVISRDAIDSINTRVDRKNDYILDIGIKKDGIDVLKKIKENDKKQRLILTLDDDVVFVKEISDEIENNRISITGKKRNEANILRAILNNVSQNLYLNISGNKNLGPNERVFTKKKLLKTILLGILMICVLMILLYRKSGIIIDISFLVTCFYILVCLHILPYNLTLTNIIGLGAILPLFIGSVVTIQEKIKCKIRENDDKVNFRNIKDIHYDIVYPILDGHMFVFLICIAIFFCLYNVNIRGFFAIISASVAVSFLTSYYFTYFLFWLMFRLKRLCYMSFSWSFNKDIFQNLRIDFVKLSFLAYIFFWLLFSFGMYSIYKKGVMCSADLSGGYKYIVEMPGNNIYDAKTLQNSLRKNLHRDNIIVKTYGSNDTYEITIGRMYDNKNVNDGEIILSSLCFALDDILKPQLLPFDNNRVLSNDDKMPQHDSSSDMLYSEAISSESNDKINKNSLNTDSSSYNEQDIDVSKKYKFVKQYKIASSITKKMLKLLLVFCIILLILFLYILLRSQTLGYAFTSIISCLHSYIGVFSIYGLMRYFGYDIVLDNNLIAFIFVLFIYSIKNIINIIGSINGHINVTDYNDNNFDNSIASNINRFVNRELSCALITLFSMSMFVSTMCFMECISIGDFWFVFLSLFFVAIYSPFFITIALLKFLFWNRMKVKLEERDVIDKSNF